MMYKKIYDASNVLYSFSSQSPYRKWTEENNEVMLKNISTSPFVFFYKDKIQGSFISGLQVGPDVILTVFGKSDVENVDSINKCNDPVIVTIELIPPKLKSNVAKTQCFGNMVLILRYLNRLSEFTSNVCSIEHCDYDTYVCDLAFPPNDDIIGKFISDFKSWKRSRKPLNQTVFWNLNSNSDYERLKGLEEPTKIL